MCRPHLDRDEDLCNEGTLNHIHHLDYTHIQLIVLDDIRKPIYAVVAHGADKLCPRGSQLVGLNLGYFEPQRPVFRNGKQPPAACTTIIISAVGIHLPEIHANTLQHPARFFNKPP